MPLPIELTGLYKRLKFDYLTYTSGDWKIPEILAIKHFPSLDGLRGVSILLVVLSHGFFETQNRFLINIFSGALGVRIFFVISGFLITTLLLKEKINSGSVSLKSFYARRFLKIIPGAYLYILIILLLNHILNLHIPALAFIGATLYLQDFMRFHISGYFNHYWSLSVEEQYYLIFPLILARNLKVFSLLLPILLVTIHTSLFGCYHIKILHGSLLQQITDFALIFDGVISGSFFSLLVFKNLIPWRFINQYRILINVGSFVILIFNYVNQIPFFQHFLSWFVGAILISNLIPSRDVIFRLLNSKIMVKIGLVSYSIYIWQGLYTWAYSMPNYRNLIWLHFPLNILPLCIIGYLFYQFWERPFLKLKSKV